MKRISLQDDLALTSELGSDALIVRNDRVEITLPIDSEQIDGIAADALTALNRAQAALDGAISGVIGYATFADLEADTTQDENTVGEVMNDPDASLNGRYRWDGAAWVQATRGYDPLDVEGLIGGSNVSHQRLIEWTEAEAYQPTSITRNSDGVVTTADVVWPDGSEGEFTATDINTTWLAIDGYTITHEDSEKTVTQAAVTRDGDGNVTTKPALTVSA